MALTVIQKFEATLDEAELNLAIANHIRSRVAGMSSANFDIVISAKRSPSGFKAVVSLAEKESEDVPTKTLESESTFGTSGIDGPIGDAGSNVAAGVLVSDDDDAEQVAEENDDEEEHETPEPEVEPSKRKLFPSAG